MDKNVYNQIYKIKTIVDLQKLLQDEIKVSTVLEYKSSFGIQSNKWKASNPHP